MLVTLALLLSGALAQDTQVEAGPIMASATLEPRSGSTTTGLVTFVQTTRTDAPDTTAPGTGAPGTGADPAMGGGHMGGGHMGGGHMGQLVRAHAPIEVSIRLVNATPGNHAVFLHENGDCSAPDASSAGGYYAGVRPMGHPSLEPVRPGSMRTNPPWPATPDLGGGMGTDGTTGEAPSTSTPDAGAPGDANRGLSEPPPGYLGFVTVGAEGRGEKDLTLHGYTLTDGAGSLTNRAVVVYERAPDFTAGEEPGARQACGVIRKREAPLGTE